MKNETIIVIGANGQIGSELTSALRKVYGSSKVVATDIRLPNDSLLQNGPFEILNVMEKSDLTTVFNKYKPTQIYLLAAMLSATGEQKPKLAWDLNMVGLLNVLDLAVERKIPKVYWPSSIAVFGDHSPKVNTPQYCVMDPSTVYGISKLAGERWCEYYYQKHGLDVRSLRYPGIISHKALPGGGTTDYAVHIFFEALKSNAYHCFLSENTTLPMMYMDDAITGTLALMEADAKKLSIWSSYNIAGFSFNPKELAEEITKFLPDFKMSYLENDPRQAIADSWPQSIDDSFARKDWGWSHQYDFETDDGGDVEGVAN